MTDEELREALEFSLRTNKVLALENDVFERYLYRHDPQCLRSKFTAYIKTSSVYFVCFEINVITTKY